MKTTHSPKRCNRPLAVALLAMVSALYPDGAWHFESGERIMPPACGANR